MLCCYVLCSICAVLQNTRGAVTTMRSSCMPFCRWSAEEGSPDVVTLISNDACIIEEAVNWWPYAILCEP